MMRGASQDPLFVFEDGKGLTQDCFIGAVREVLQAAAGIDTSKYAGYSFRVRAACTAARNGVQDSLIKTIGCWESLAYMLYIRTLRETLCTVAGTLANFGGKGQEISPTIAASGE